MQLYKSKLLSLIAVLSVFGGPSQASPSCMRDHRPFQLAGDTIEWSMAIAPGLNCIQGLRWSTMQIFDVSVVKAPTKGNLVLVGPGFRYFASPTFSGKDRFSLLVVGQNRHDRGTSIVQVEVSNPLPALSASAN